MGNPRALYDACAVAALVLLSACGRGGTVYADDLDDRMQAEQDIRASSIGALEERIQALEDRLAHVESENIKDVNAIAGLAKANVSDIQFANKEFDRLSENDKAFLAQINYLRALQGLPPMPEKK